MAQRFRVLVYYKGTIQKNGNDIFVSENTSSFYVNNGISLIDLKRVIKRNIEIEDGERVYDIKYRMPISLSPNGFLFRAHRLRNDEDVQMMFDCHQESRDLTVIEIYAEVKDAVSGSVQRRVRSVNIRSEVGEGTSSRSGGTQYRPEIDLNYGYGNSDIDEDADTESGSEGHDGNDEGAEFEEQNLVNIVGQGTTEMVPYEPPTFMRQLNLEAMSAPEFPEYPHLYVNTQTGATTGGELCIGMQYRSKEEAMMAIKQYSIQHSVEYVVIESDPTRYVGRCNSYGDGCNWRVRASYSKRKQVWEIKKYNGPHTCTSEMISQDHSKLDSSMICAAIKELVSEKPSINVYVLLAEIRNRYGYTTTYRTA